MTRVFDMGNNKNSKTGGGEAKLRLRFRYFVHSTLLIVES